jgi:N-acetylglucosaminyl-diphospho-decaprenol L-rhamnosyltransferase
VDQAGRRVNDAVSVVIPNYNGASFIGSCLDALLAQERPPDDVLVVDNGSTDGSAAMLREKYPDVRVEALVTNLGFAGGVNHGIRATSTPLVAVLNSDAIVDRRWLAELLAAPRPDDVWAWGSVLVAEETGRIESAGDLCSPLGLASKHLRDRPLDELPTEPYEVFAPPGAAPLLRRDVFDELGGYADHFFMYYEDVDLAFRARLRGYRALQIPTARVRHALGKSGTPSISRYHIARNSTWCAIRNLPDVGPGIVWAGIRRGMRDARKRGYLGPFMKGKAAALVALPAVLRQRRAIQASRTIGADAVAAMFGQPHTR